MSLLLKILFVIAWFGWVAFIAYLVYTRDYKKQLPFDLPDLPWEDKDKK